MRPITLRAALFALTLLGGLNTSLVAQSILVVEHDKKPYRVVNARGSQPFVEVNGKLVAADGNRFAMKKIDDFLPVFVSVGRVKVGTSSVNLVDSGSSINNTFNFRGEFSSAYPLDDIFIALELQFEDGNKSIFIREVGHLDRDHPRTIDISLPTGFPLGRGHYQLHVYAAGVEVLQSLQPFAAREAALDRFVAKRVREAKDGPPQPLVGPPPDYPEKLFKAKTSGHAKLKLRVRSTGAVVDLSVVEATDPAFGEAALESMRQWRFIPRIKDGRPVDTVVEMPVNFTPPADKKS